MTSTPTPARTVLVTGAARGLGRALCQALADRGDHVIVSARDYDSAQSFVMELTNTGKEAHALELDVSSNDSVRAAAEALRAMTDHVDILVNNAAIDYDVDEDAAGADLDRVKRTLETNLFGPWRCTQAFLPLMRAGSSVIMVTSEVASLADMSEGAPGYRVSKVGLNALTRVLAVELAPRAIDVRAVSPGWTATDMGGPEGRPLSDGVSSLLAGIDLPPGTTGTFSQDGQPLAW